MAELLWQDLLPDAPLVQRWADHAVHPDPSRQWRTEPLAPSVDQLLRPDSDFIRKVADCIKEGSVRLTHFDPEGVPHLTVVEGKWGPGSAIRDLFHTIGYYRYDRRGAPLGPSEIDYWTPRVWMPIGGYRKKK